MDIRCPNCQTLYEFDEGRLKKGPVNLKCSQCAHVFRVEGKTRDAPAPRRWMLRKVPSGDVLYFQGLSSLQKWIVDRKVTREDEISKTGRTWKKLGSINELASFFQVADSISDLHGAPEAPPPAPAEAPLEPPAAPAPTPAPPPELAPVVSAPPSPELPESDYFDPLAPGAPASGPGTGAWKLGTPEEATSQDWAIGAEQAASEAAPAPALDFSGELAPPRPLEPGRAALEAGMDDPLLAPRREPSALPWVLVLLLLLAGGFVGYAFVYQPELLGLPPQAQGAGDADAGAGATLTGTPSASQADASMTAADTGSALDAALATAADVAPADKPDADAPDAALAVAQKPDAAELQKPDASQAEVASKEPPRTTPPAASDKPRQPPAEAVANNFDSLMKRAKDNLNAGRAHEALRDYANAADQRPNNISAICGKGRAYMALGRPEGAIMSFQQALQISPGNGLALIGLGDAYRRAGQNQKALEIYRQYIDRYPSGPTSDRARRNIEMLGGTPP